MYLKGIFVDRKLLKNIHINDVQLADLLNRPEDFEAVASRFEHIIWSSFAHIDKKLNPNMDIKPPFSEIKRRFDICLKWFRIMRLDLGFGQQRALDILSWVLANVLLEIEFSLEDLKTRAWSPDVFKPSAVLSKS